MNRFRNQILIGLSGLLLIFSLMGCGEDDEGEIPEVSRAAYILNGAAETLSVFNLETSEMENDVLPVGKWPNDIQIVDNKAYVVNTGDNNVQIIDLATLTDTGIIDVGEGSGPEKIGFVGGKAYVSCNYTGTANVVDLASGSVTKSIEVGVGPWGVAVVGQKVYVSNTAYDGATFSYGDGTVSVIDSATDEVIKTINVETNPTEIVAFGGSILVQCTGNYAEITGKLSVIDTASDTVTQTIDLGTAPSGIAISPNGKAYITSFGGLIPVDLSSGTIEGPLADFGGGAGLAFDKAGNGYICVPDWAGAGGDKLLIMDSSEGLAGSYGPGGGASIIAINE